MQQLVARTVYTPVREGSAVAETVERLGRAIGMGLLRPGDRLPPESRLAEDLGISPVTLRNAIAILRGAGLVETQRGRGIGSRLIGAAHDWMLSRGASKATVVTQGANLPACALYRRAGYTIEHAENYYHFWP